MSARVLDVDDDPPFDDYPREAQRVERFPRPEGFSGAISLPLLPDLIQIYTASLADGALTIRRDGEEGTIWFERGQMVHAVCGPHHGEEAVYRLLQWQDGYFSLDSNASVPDRTITASWQNVLMEGCRRLDEEGKSDEASSDIGRALEELERTLNVKAALAIFDGDGALIVRQSNVPGLDFDIEGAELVEMLRRQRIVMRALSQAPTLLDCFWILEDQLHFIAPLAGGRLLHLVLDGTNVNLAVIRRAIDRIVVKLLGKDLDTDG